MKVGDNDQREHVNANSEKDMIACAKSQRQKWVCPPKKQNKQTKKKPQSAFADLFFAFFNIVFFILHLSGHL